MVRNTTRVHLLKALLIASTAIIPVASVSVAQAQTAARLQPASFDIPAQSLSDSLAAFARATGLRIVYPAELAQGKSAPAVQGALTQSQALERLLSGSGLAWRLTGGNAVTIYYKSSSAAGAAPVDADGSLVLDTITVAGGSRGFSSDTPYETAGSSAYISGEQMEQRRGTSTGDFLQGIPGVMTGENRNSGAIDVNIRGMQGMNRVPVVVDGASNEVVLYKGYAGVASASYVDPDMISSVAIEKGPSSSADANGAIGGVVRMSTIGVDDVVLPSKSFGIRLKGGFNSNSSSAPAVGTFGGLRLPGAGFSTVGVYANDQLPSSFGGPEGMDRPGFLKPTSGSGSIAAGFRSDHVDVVAAYSRRRNGNYHAGTHGDGQPEPWFIADCAGALASGSCYNPRAGWTAVGIDGLNRYRAGEEVLNTSFDNTSYLLKGTFRADGGHRLDLGFTRFESDFGQMMPSQITRGEGSYQNYLSTAELDTYTAKYAFNPDDDDLVDLKISVGLTNLASVDRTSSSVGYYIANNQRDSHRWTASVDNTSRFDTLFGPVSMNYGVSYAHEKLSELTSYDGVSYADRLGRSGTRQEINGFGSAEWKPYDWLTLNGSLRYSNFKTRDNNRRYLETQIISYFDENGTTVTFYGSRRQYERAGGTGTFIRTDNILIYEDPFAQNGSGFAPILSATVEPWKGVQFYAKYAEALRGPSLWEATTGDSSTGLRSFDVIDPEHARNWEFGLNVLRDDLFLAGDAFRFKAAYFNNNIENYITRFDDAARLYRLGNLDNARMRGIEISGEYDTGKYFVSAAWNHYLETEFCHREDTALTASQPRCTSGGMDESYAGAHIPPKDTVSLTAGVRLLDRRLTLGGRLTHVGERASTQVTGMTVEWTPYTLADLFASYKINENFQIDAAIDNLTDVYYMDALTLGMMPSPGRTFRLNMTAKF
ncbi:hemoglobin/transferrin/lactoferrin receptor protein [Aquamicrobium lusatiense]|uniref:Hemoglobin/transferrin/lactoferrin receptor protein n=1 Tax=Aquamicrobium lusatiense TaxID=89772 RepID=A0A7W9VUK0_9HYPH|nr:TonB-dependent receptor [Aquamicrobium lusatiense]MBB6011776.1 hemoglobin/transferrin/lactoferrin receptor protein [Aquamicrobium lusatiense]